MYKKQKQVFIYSNNLLMEELLQITFALSQANNYAKIKRLMRFLKFLTVCEH